MTLRRKRRFRVAIVGCGKIAGGYDMPRSRARGKIRTHIKGYLSDRRFEVVAVCDSNARKLKTFCKHWKIPNAYRNLESMLAQELPDVVSVCVPTSAHRATLEAIARHPVQLVFAEKPFTASRRDAELVLKTLKARKIAVAVNYLRRWCPNHQRLKKIIESGKLGRLRSFDAIYSGDLENIGSHLIDLIAFLAGPIVSVQTGGGRRSGELGLKGGVKGYLERSPIDRFDLQLLFDRGFIGISRYGYEGECRVWSGAGDRSAARLLFRFSAPARGIDSAMKHAVANLGDHLSRGLPLSSDSQGAIKVLTVCGALGRPAARGGRTIRLSA